MLTRVREVKGGCVGTFKYGISPAKYSIRPLTAVSGRRNSKGHWNPCHDNNKSPVSPILGGHPQCSLQDPPKADCTSGKDMGCNGRDSILNQDRSL